MIKKTLGISLLVVVIGLLAFGAINRTSAKAGELLPVSADVVEGYGPGYGGGRTGTEVATPAAPIEEEDVDGYGRGYGDGEPLIDTLPLGELSQAEIDGLLFMYEEEKLARDVYNYLTTLYTQPMFGNIANAEQNHMNSVGNLLDRYGIEVPVADKAGLFENADLQQLYTDLTAKGSQSLADALLVGAAIEEIDILDLKEELELVDQADIQRIYESLLYGSYNHLNSFSSLYAQQAGAPYEPQYMSEADWTEYQTYLAENGVSGSGGRGRRGGSNAGGGGGRR